MSQGMHPGSQVYMPQQPLQPIIPTNAYPINLGENIPIHLGKRNEGQELNKQPEKVPFT